MSVSNLTRAVLARQIEEKLEEFEELQKESQRLSEELREACTAYILAMDKIINEMGGENA